MTQKSYNFKNFFKKYFIRRFAANDIDDNF